VRKTSGIFLPRTAKNNGTSAIHASGQTLATGNESINNAADIMERSIER
jgi:hypothetical protein